MELPEGRAGGLYIRVPRSQNSKREGVFSRPAFALDDYPMALRELGRHGGLLSIELFSRVWRFLLMIYPGGEATLQRAIELGVVDRAKPITPRAGAKEASISPPGFEEDLAAFGTAAVARAAKREGGRKGEALPKQLCSVGCVPAVVHCEALEA